MLNLYSSNCYTIRRRKWRNTDANFCCAEAILFTLDKSNMCGIFVAKCEKHTVNHIRKSRSHSSIKTIQIGDIVSLLVPSI